MTDRELLELAAKAGGFDLLDCTCKKERKNSVTGKHWNPLEDDGDALRLAVKLGIHLAMDCETAGIVTAMWNFDESGDARNIIEQDAPFGGDDYAATRRAITRAAAAIGEKL